jgi:fructoselysine-6-P-deglycase FrlB-like protein
MERSGWLDKIREHFDPKAEWLFVGCGSSYCIGLAPDLLIELNLEVPEYARPVAYLLAGQLLGHYTGLRKGMDPDNPRFLSRVAILDERA